MEISLFISILQLSFKVIFLIYLSFSEICGNGVAD